MKSYTYDNNDNITGVKANRGKLYRKWTAGKIGIHIRQYRNRNFLTITGSDIMWQATVITAMKI